MSLGAQGLSAIVIGYGNTLRHDDGVAWRTLELLGALPGVELLHVQQLTPELASDVARADVAVFVDADLGARTVRISAVTDAGEARGLSHTATPAEIAQVARVVFGARGRAFVCSVPVTDLSPGEGLSACGAISARIAARAIARFLQECGPRVKFRDTEERE